MSDKGRDFKAIVQGWNVKRKLEMESKYKKVKTENERKDGKEQKGSRKRYS